MISIIIPTLNEYKVIEPLLKSLKNQLSEEDEIVIVDSQSKDNTIKIANKYTKSIYSTPKQGVGLARTYGAKKAKNDYVAFLDADSVVSENWLKRIKEYFKQGYTAVGGLDLYHSDSWLNKGIYNNYSRLVYLLSRVVHFTTGRYWIPSNNSAFDKKLFFSVGGYRSVVCEDIDLMKKLPSSRKVRFDSRIYVILSDRRFKEEGFLGTLWIWTKADIKGIFGDGMDVLKGYTKN
ncbi:MAG TPA: glycosyltransferase [Candidatus Bilamarchaeaceae archaeon]|nr:glycosyltransferase [Candidatus Bilamarchaeaceae archaeon]